jgi:hypothetical protein
MSKPTTDDLMKALYEMSLLLGEGGWLGKSGVIQKALEELP